MCYAKCDGRADRADCTNISAEEVSRRRTALQKKTPHLMCGCTWVKRLLLSILLQKKKSCLEDWNVLQERIWLRTYLFNNHHAAICQYTANLPMFPTYNSLAITRAIKAIICLQVTNMKRWNSCRKLSAGCICFNRCLSVFTHINIKNLYRSDTWCQLIYKNIKQI